jgi:prepilin-type N-terminal cleavage/methylation domain-containing protein
MSLRFFKHKNGFSLIELLTALAIISLTLSVGLYAFTNYNLRSSKLQDASNNQVYLDNVFNDFYDFYLTNNLLIGNCTLMDNSTPCNFQYSNFTTIPIQTNKPIKIILNQNATNLSGFGNLTQYENNPRIIFFMNASGKSYKKVIYSNLTKNN